MFDLFLAHVLVLLLLLITGFRVFFIKNPRVDSVAVASPVAFLISLLLFLVWGVNIQSVLVLALSFIFFLTNLRALFRLSAELIVDDYSPAFKIVTIFELLLAILVAIFIFWTRPVRYVPKDFGVEKNVRSLTGNFATGFHTLEDYSEIYHGAKETGTLTVYSPAEKIVWENQNGSLFNSLADDQTFVDVIEEFESKKEESSAEVEAKAESEQNSSEENVETENDVIEEVSNEYAQLPLLLFVGTTHAPVDCYEPYFLFLAQKGFTVLAADFFPPDASLFDDWRGHKIFSRLFSVFAMAIDKNEDEKNRILAQEFENTRRGYEVLSALAIKEYNLPIFYICEGFDFDTILEISKKFDENFVGFFSLNRIEEYKAPKFGFVEQTDVFLAHYLGIDRDREFFIPRYAAFKTIQSFDSQFSKYKIALRKKESIKNEE